MTINSNCCVLHWLSIIIGSHRVRCLLRIWHWCHWSPLMALNWVVLWYWMHSGNSLDVLVWDSPKLRKHEILYIWPRRQFVKRYIISKLMVSATINAYLSDIFIFVPKCPNWWHKDRRYDAPTMLISAILYLKIYLCPKGSIKKILHISQTHSADVAYLRNVTARYTPKM